MLSKHIEIGRPWDLDRKEGGVVILPPFQGNDQSWYKGTANAVYQNIEYVDKYDPDLVIILSGDHIYGMDYREMIDFHLSKKADGTLACLRVPISEASRFGIILTDFENNITGFQEKPKEPKSDLASLGIYVFNWKFLKRRLVLDENNKNSDHDFGKNILPEIVEKKEGKLYAFLFDGYWRDVGTIKSLWESNLELTRPMPPFNLYDPNWKFYTKTEEYPPAFVGKEANVKNSLINEGSQIYGNLQNSVIFQGVYVGKNTHIRNSVIMTDTYIGNNCKIENTVIGENTVVNDNVSIGLGESVENEFRPDIYNSDLVSIGSNVEIPENVSIGKNSAINSNTKKEKLLEGVKAGKVIY
jgi:glucose-1-phosphate adenylyltransferase